MEKEKVELIPQMCVAPKKLFFSQKQIQSQDCSYVTVMF